MKILAKPIEMISLTPSKGKPIPLRFRYREGDGESCVYKVEVLQIDETKVAGVPSLVYRCQSRVMNEVKLYELKYIIPECRWQLYKA